MKNIKTFLLGFLTCTSLFLIMGQTNINNEIGKYQISISTHKNKSVVFETTLDTQTGKVFKREKVNFYNFTKKIDE